MRVKLIACKVMEAELRHLMEREQVGWDTEFVELDLHLYPDRLRHRLQALLDESGGYDRIVLAFGLCGGGTRGLGNTDAILTIPRFHDCVPVLLGGEERYRQIHSEETGTLYMCRGWLESRTGFSQQYADWCAQYGEESAHMLRDAMYGAYRRLLLIRPQHLRCGTLRQKAVDCARSLELDYGEIDGRDDILEALVTGRWDDEALFVNLPPRGILADSHFGL